MRSLEHPHGVRGDQRPPCEHAEVERLEMREERVVAFDRHHRLPGLDAVAVVERVDGQSLPVVRTELEDGDRLVHAAEERMLLLEYLHHHARVPALGLEQLLGEVEVGVGVVALPQLFDGQP